MGARAGAGAEDRHRSAQRGRGRRAVGRVEAEELPREVVCGRGDLGRHRPGSDGGDAGAACAGDWRASLRAARCGGRMWSCRTSFRPNYRQAIIDSYPGSGDAKVPIDPATWETITDGMAAVTDCQRHGLSAHLEGIDFAGQDGHGAGGESQLRRQIGLEGRAIRAPMRGLSAWRRAAIRTSWWWCCGSMAAGAQGLPCWPRR